MHNNDLKPFIADHRSRVIRLIMAWPMKKAVLTYFGFLLMAILMVTGGGGDPDESQAEPPYVTGLFIVFGPLWMLGGLIVGGRLLSEFQLDVIRSLKEQTETTLIYKREIQAARENCFYSKWIDKKGGKSVSEIEKSGDRT